MSWPTMTDFQEAIQNPGFCFADQELQHGSPVLNNLGLPMPITGGFASVYQVQCNSRRYAVRCFMRYHPDQEQRYAKISDYLHKVNLPYMVGFKFLNEGILVRGHWYPILKMEWIDGQPLNIFVDKYLNNSKLILETAERFLNLVLDLKKNSIAHGDLQHGNILVVNNELKLIDYDGMFVPGLENLTSLELGHRNYQHPLRSDCDFGPYLDNFSAWIIYTSLIALGIKPSLWKQVGSGDGEEFLLFRKEDFEDPYSSKAIEILEKESSSTINSFATLLQTILCNTNISQVPPLSKSVPVFSSTPRTIRAGLPDWLEDQAKDIQDSSNNLEEITESPQDGLSWIFDHLGKQADYCLSLTGLLERLVIGFFSITAMLTATLGQRFIGVKVASIIIGLEIPLLALFLLIRYRMLPEVSEKQMIRSRLQNIQKETINLEKSVDKTKEKIQNLSKAEKQKAEVNSQKNKELNQNKFTEIKKAENDYQNAISSINVKRQNLRQEESKELANAIQKIASRLKASKLAQYSISNANITGIGPQLKSRLIAWGINSAADIEDVHVVPTGWGRYSHDTAYIKLTSGRSIHVDGIGPAKARSLLAWKKHVESKIQVNATLSATEESAIKAKYQSKMRELDVEESSVKNTAKTRKDQIEKKYVLLKDDLIKDMNLFQQELTLERKELTEKITDDKKKLTQKRWERTKIEKELKGFLKITFKSYLKKLLEDKIVVNIWS